ncbi:MAG: preprotein translocase subunit SecG [Alphaproteobacteria bacterium RIFOXYD12_FULL_60_8]|nr:MAG: preprotein translocase subunit SecG [Alphaproteobacteria bacterium RIFOXYD12_FULL_60_8]
MLTVLLVIHLIIAIALVGVILMQRSEGGALGMGGSGGGLVSSRSAGNLLTRTTAILAAAFMATSLTLAIMANSGREPATSILDKAPETAPAPAEAPAAAPEAAPAGPAVPPSK